MTVFTTSSPRQIPFQISFLYKKKCNGTNTPTQLTVARTDIHLYECVLVILRDPPWRRPADDWRRFSWRRTAGGRTRQARITNRGEKERDRGGKSLLFFLSTGMICRLWKHILRRRARTCSLGVVRVFVGRNLGSFKWVSHHWKGGLIITFVYSLHSILHQAL